MSKLKVEDCGRGIIHQKQFGTYKEDALQIEIEGYQIHETIFQSAQTLIFKAIRQSDQLPVIIKTLSNDYPSTTEITRVRYEYQLTKKGSNVPGVINIYDLVKDGNRLSLILEDFGGIDLRSFLQESRGISLKEFFEISIQLVRTLGGLHHYQIIHKDINPSNIIQNVKTGEVKIIDFGLSTELAREQQDINVANQLEGTLAYISPEQTGRMNRKLDYRTDYYSLGVTFYELLAGTPPFQAEDTMGWVHCHIAKAPPNLHKVNPSIPESLSNIVQKMTSKNAEDRYQSARGLIYDLEVCQNKWKEKIDSFELGQRDVSEKFQIPQKLFGREKEMEILLGTFDEAAQGGIEYLLVSGYSGMGKSALVHEVHKPIVRQHGYFLEGKFDQFQKHIPYSAMIQAFQGLVKQLLSEPEERLEQWKSLLLKALAPNGQIIIDLIPELETIIGRQPPVTDLNPTEAQNRFLFTFRQFIKVFARREHPLVIFLDDLQWSDLPTLKLMESLVLSKDIRYFFLIGAYRDNEAKEAHPLLASIEEIQKIKSFSRIVLKPLEERHVNQLISETVYCDLKTSEPLASLIFQKTAGNPFFVNELLINLYQADRFRFLPEAGQWSWNLENLSKIEVTDNVVELMIERLKKLPQDTQQALLLASCIGNHFDLKTLAMIDKHTLNRTGKILAPALQEGILVPLSHQYRWIALQEENKQTESDFGVTYQFQHDRVQQAAYSLIQEDKKKEVHLTIGRLMLQRSNKAETEERLIEIVRHLNEGRKIIRDMKEQDQLTMLNLRAGKKAKASTAYHPALEYLRTAKELLPENCWETCYEPAFEIHKEFTEVAYLSGKLEVAEEAGRLLLENTKTVTHRVEVHRIQMNQHILTGNLREAIQAGTRALSLLGITVNSAPGSIAVLKELFLVKWNLRNRRIEDLIDLPQLNNPKILIILRILVDLGPPSYLLGRENLFVILILKGLNLSLRYGNSPEAAVNYAWYATLLGGVWGNYRKSLKMGDLAVRLNEKLGDLQFRSRIIFLYAFFVHSWNYHWKTTIPLYQKSIDSGYQSGDLLYSGYSCIWLPKSDPGCALEESVRIGRKYLELLKPTKNQNAIDTAYLFHQLKLNFMGKTFHRLTLNDDTFDEDECLDRKYQSEATGVAIFYVTKLQKYYTYESYEKSLEMIQKGDPYIKAIAGMLSNMEYSFYTFLSFAALYTQMRRKEKKQALKRMKKEYKQMRKWHDHFDGNSKHLVAMMEAEFARIYGNTKEAVQQYYKRAIEAAEKNEFLWHQALANELAAKYYLTQNNELSAKYMKEAHYLYTRWGATAKAEHMEETNPDIFASHHTYETASTALDLPGVMKAFQAISREKDFEKLLKTLMHILLENAGAVKGFLIIENNGQYSIEAEGAMEKENTFARQSVPLNQAANLSIGIVNFVIRAKEKVVLNDAVHEGPFINDPFIKKSKPKSILCLPIFNRGKLSAIFYAENRLVSGAFTRERLEVLQMLSSQAAISLENAGFYSILEQKIADRTEALLTAKNQAEESTKLKDKFLSLVSHDLKLPLTGMVTMLKHLKENHSGHTDINESSAKVQHLINSSEGMVNLINELLNISRFKTGRIEPSKKLIDINSLLAKQMDNLVHLAGEKGIKIIQKIPDEYKIIADPALIGEVLQNLISNAIKFCGRGDNITIYIPEDRTAVIAVKDTGTGIDKSMLSDLFKHEVRTTMTGTAGEKGTGLGLPYCHDIITAHKGSINVESIKEKGTVFYLKFPDIKRMVLIADDHNSQRRIVKELLNKITYLEVIEAENGKQVIEILDYIVPELIITDLKMPEIDGYHVAMAVRKQEKGTGRHIPILALTADSNQNVYRNCLNAGMDEYLPKPVNLNDLSRKVRSLIPEGLLKPHKLSNTNTGDRSEEQKTQFFDLAKLRETFNNDEEKIKPLVKWILDDASLQISLIINAMEKEDYDRISKSSHRIKASATQIGSDKLYKLALELEEMGIAGIMGEIPEKLEDLKECFKTISESLKKDIFTHEIHEIK